MLYPIYQLIFGKNMPSLALRQDQVSIKYRGVGKNGTGKNGTTLEKMGQRWKKWDNFYDAKFRWKKWDKFFSQ